MDDIVLEEEIKKIIMPILEGQGIDMVELHLIKGRNASIVRLLADRPCGGISIGDLAYLNRKIGEVLETSALIKDNYDLEVFSPGLDRPLKTKSDFSRCINKQVKFFLREAIHGKIEIQGGIEKVGEEAVSLKVGDDILDLPLSNISMAKQVIK